MSPTAQRIANDALFEACIFRKKNEIVCKLGLWAVEGPDPATVEREARHYWIQYFTDGEYDELLSS